MKLTGNVDRFNLNTGYKKGWANAVLNEHAVSYKEAFGRKLTQKAVLGFIGQIVKTHPFFEVILVQETW